MHHDGGVHIGIFEHTGVNHVLGAAENLLGGLEHELDGALNLVLMGLEQPGGAQQHGGVHIVAAGVHPAVGAGKRLAGGLLNGQGVHIGAEQNGLAGVLAAQQHHKSRLAAGNGGQAHLLQFAFDNGKRIVQVKAGLGMGMKFAAHGDHLGRKGGGLLHQLILVQHHKISFRFCRSSWKLLFFFTGMTIV